MLHGGSDVNKRRTRDKRITDRALRCGLISTVMSFALNLYRSLLALIIVYTPGVFSDEVLDGVTECNESLNSKFVLERDTISFLSRGRDTSNSRRASALGFHYRAGN